MIKINTEKKGMPEKSSSKKTIIIVISLLLLCFCAVCVSIFVFMFFVNQSPGAPSLNNVLQNTNLE